MRLTFTHGENLIKRIGEVAQAGGGLFTAHGLFRFVFKKFLAHEPIRALAGKRKVTLRGQILPEQALQHNRVLLVPSPGTTTKACTANAVHRPISDPVGMVLVDCVQVQPGFAGGQIGKVQHPHPDQPSGFGYVLEQVWIRQPVRRLGS